MDSYKAMPVNRRIQLVDRFENLAKRIASLGTSMSETGRPGIFNAASVDAFTKGFICGFAALLLASSQKSNIRNRAIVYISRANTFMEQGRTLLFNNLGPRAVAESEAVLPTAVLTLMMGQLQRKCPGRNQNILKVYWDYYKQLVGPSNKEEEIITLTRAYRSIKLRWIRTLEST
jgi:hypothetical protein